MVEENTSSEDIELTTVGINDSSTEVVAPPVETPSKKESKPWITLDQVRKAEPREVEVFALDDEGNETQDFIGIILARPATMKMRRIVKKKLKENYAHLDEEETALMEAALLAQQIIIKPEISDDAIENGDLRLISMMARAATNAFGRKSIIELKK